MVEGELSRSGKTPLLLASEQGKTEVVELLVQVMGGGWGGGMDWGETVFCFEQTSIVWA